MSTYRPGLPFTGERRPGRPITPHTRRFRPPPVRGVVTRENDHLAIRFSGHSMPFINAVKSIRGARWHQPPPGSKIVGHYSVHVGNIQQVRLVAARLGWTLSAQVQAIPDVDVNAFPMMVSVEGEQLVIDGPWRADIVEILEDADARLDDLGRWRVPLEQCVDVVMDMRDVANVRFVGESNQITDRIAQAQYMLTLSRQLTKTEGWQISPRIARDIDKREFQHSGIEYAWRSPRTFNWATMGAGKGLRDDQRVLTPWGWRPISDLEVGDVVVGGSTGLPVRVLGVYPQGIQELWRITTNDGASVVADASHQWSVQVAGSSLKTWRCSTKDMLDDGLFRYRSPVPSRPGEYLNRLILPPLPSVAGGCLIPTKDAYALGVWLGDGTWGNGYPSVTTHRLDAAQMAKHAGSGAVHERRGDSAHFSLGVNFGRWLATLGLEGKGSHERFVPDVLMTADRLTRLALLQGLLDTDGSPDQRHSAIEYCSTSERLAQGVVALVQSLGGIARISESRVTTYPYAGEQRDGRPSWRVAVKLMPGDAPFSVTRKASRYVAPTKYLPARRIERITRQPDAASTCIAVDDPAGLFITEGYIVTHNTTVALCAIEQLDWTTKGEGRAWALDFLTKSQRAGSMITEPTTRSPYPLLVVCPSGLKTNWVREIAASLPHLRPWVCEGRVPTRPLWTPDVWIANYDILGLPEDGKPKRLSWITFFTQMIERGEIGSYIVDEGHRCNSPKTQRTVAALEASNALPPDAPRMLLTGTPVRNGRRQELVPQLGVIGRNGEFGDVKQLKADRRLSRRLRTVCAWRPEPAAVLKALGVLGPDGTADPIWQPLIIDGDPKILAEYRRAEEHFLDWLRDKARAKAIELGEDPESAAVAAAMNAGKAEALMLIGALCRLAGQAKIKAAKEWVADFETTGEKLVVFAENVDMMEAISDGKIPLIRGGVSHDKRTKLVDAFQDEEWVPEGERIQTLVCQIVAAGEGITLTKAYQMLFTQIVWAPGAMDQAAARAAWRMNDPHNVICHVLVCADTIDEDRMDVLDSKREAMALVTDGDQRAAMGEESTYGDVFARMLARALGIKDRK